VREQGQTQVLCCGDIAVERRHRTHARPRQSQAGTHLHRWRIRNSLQAAVQQTCCRLVRDHQHRKCPHSNTTRNSCKGILQCSAAWWLTMTSVARVAAPAPLLGCSPPLTSFKSTPACFARCCALNLYILHAAASEHTQHAVYHTNRQVMGDSTPEVCLPEEQPYSGATFEQGPMLVCCQIVWPTNNTPIQHCKEKMPTARGAAA